MYCGVLCCRKADHRWLSNIVYTHKNSFYLKVARILHVSGVNIACRVRNCSNAHQCISKWANTDQYVIFRYMQCNYKPSCSSWRGPKVHILWLIDVVHSLLIRVFRYYDQIPAEPPFTNFRLQEFYFVLLVEGFWVENRFVRSDIRFSSFMIRSSFSPSWLSIQASCAFLFFSASFLGFCGLDDPLFFCCIFPEFFCMGGGGVLIPVSV